MSGEPEVIADASEILDALAYPRTCAVAI